MEIDGSGTDFRGRLQELTDLAVETGKVTELGADCWRKPKHRVCTLVEVLGGFSPVGMFCPEQGAAQGQIAMFGGKRVT